MKLYDFELSGNCHKIRMLLNMLDLEAQRVNIDLREKDQLAPEFIAVNPMHKVPVLEDDGVILRDSAAIMIYLARSHGRTEWYPDAPHQMASVQQWLSFSVNEVFNGLAMVRANVIFNRGLNKPPLEAAAAAALDVMEHRLEKHDWLALDQFTLADLGCYPYTALSHEGGVDLSQWPAVKRWCARIETLPGYLAMRGLPVAI